MISYAAMEPRIIVSYCFRIAHILYRKPGGRNLIYYVYRAKFQSWSNLNSKLFVSKLNAQCLNVALNSGVHARSVDQHWKWGVGKISDNNVFWITRIQKTTFATRWWVFLALYGHFSWVGGTCCAGPISWRFKCVGIRIGRRERSLCFSLPTQIQAWVVQQFQPWL